jgi:hypothetical protein
MADTGQSNGETEDGKPKLAVVLRVKEVILRKKNEWGFVLRGTTTQYGSSLKIYTCKIDKVNQGGPADDIGLQQGDMIVAIDNKRLEFLTHQDVIRMFQESTQVDLVVVPAQYSDITAVRINPGNPQSMSYLWCLTRKLQHLEVVNVSLEKHGGIDLYLLPNLRSLRLTHCGMKDLSLLRGLSTLPKLTSLVMTHNSLKSESFLIDSELACLENLVVLDLGANELDRLPEVVIQLPRLETLVLVNNNLSSLSSHLLPVLNNLQTLCLDGNQLTNIDDAAKFLNLKCFTFSNNFIDVTPHSIGQTSYDITAISGNPFVNASDKNAGRRESIVEDRTLSIRGHTTRRSTRHSICVLSQTDDDRRRAVSLSPPPVVPPQPPSSRARPLSTIAADEQFH